MKIYRTGEREPYPADWPPQEYFVEPSLVADAVHPTFSTLPLLLLLALAAEVLSFKAPPQHPG